MLSYCTWIGSNATGTEEVMSDFLNQYLVHARWIDGELAIKTDDGWTPVGLFAEDFCSTPFMTLSAAGFPSMSVRGSSTESQFKAGLED